MTLGKARELAIDMVDALQDEKLLGQVEQARDGLASRLPDNEKQHMVARALVGVQLEVVEKHGFKGDQGYAQAQVRARGRRGGRPRPGPLRVASGAPWRTRDGGTHPRVSYSFTPTPSSRQVCLMEHAGDAVVTASVAQATTNVYARAGINLQEALRAANLSGA